MKTENLSEEIYKSKPSEEIYKSTTPWGTIEKIRMGRKEGSESSAKMKIPTDAKKALKNLKYEFKFIPEQAIEEALDITQNDLEETKRILHNQFPNEYMKGVAYARKRLLL